MAAGPFGSQRQATDAARHITSGGSWADGSQQLLLGACSRAGVTLGEYDAQMLAWLSGWEPWVIAVIVGLIERAHQAGKDGQP